MQPLRQMGIKFLPFQALGGLGADGAVAVTRSCSVLVGQSILWEHPRHPIREAPAPYHLSALTGSLAILEVAPVMPEDQGLGKNPDCLEESIYRIPMQNNFNLQFHVVYFCYM